jgi:hypothetical protein
MSIEGGYDHPPATPEDYFWARRRSVIVESGGYMLAQISADDPILSPPWGSSDRLVELAEKDVQDTEGEK